MTDVARGGYELTVLVGPDAPELLGALTVDQQFLVVDVTGVPDRAIRSVQRKLTEEEGLRSEVGVLAGIVERPEVYEPTAIISYDQILDFLSINQQRSTAQGQVAQIWEALEIAYDSWRDVVGIGDPHFPRNAEDLRWGQAVGRLLVPQTDNEKRLDLWALHDVLRMMIKDGRTIMNIGRRRMPQLIQLVNEKLQLSGTDALRLRRDKPDDDDY